MTRLGLVGVLAGALLLAACGGTEAGAPADTGVGATADATTSAAAPTTTPDAAPPPTTTTTAEPAATGPASWVMPNLVGQNLQDAQNAIQRLTDFAIFLTTSSDATGQDRSQVIDSNWLVCGQSVAAGQSITADSRIEFAAVKVTESCP